MRGTGKAVAVGTHEDNAIVFPLAGDHTYAVKTIEGDNVILFNPWGIDPERPENQPAPITFAELYKRIAEIHIQ